MGMGVSHPQLSVTLARLTLKLCLAQRWRGLLLCVLCPETKLSSEIGSNSMGNQSIPPCTLAPCCGWELLGCWGFDALFPS